MRGTFLFYRSFAARYFAFIYLSNPTRLFKHIIHNRYLKFVRKDARIHPRTITQPLDCSMQSLVDQLLFPSLYIYIRFEIYFGTPLL